MFNKLKQDTIEADTLRNGKLGGPAAIVFVKMLFSVNQNNIVQGTPEEITRDAKMTDWEFKLGIKNLKKKNIIRKYTAKEYMLNPDISYNGPDARYYILKHMWDTQTTSGLKDGK